MNFRLRRQKSGAPLFFGGFSYIDFLCRLALTRVMGKLSLIRGLFRQRAVRDVAAGSDIRFRDEPILDPDVRAVLEGPTQFTPLVRIIRMILIAVMVVSLAKIVVLIFLHFLTGQHVLPPS